ncbi:MAG: hypothetical protein ACOCYP_04130 [Planctomycetota bacterium]
MRTREIVWTREAGIVPLAFALIPLLAAVLAIGGCGGGGGGSRQAHDRKPGWVDDPPEMPGMMYTVGRARGDDRATAIDQGKRELAAQIQISVQGERTMIDEYYESADSEGHRAERMNSYVRDQLTTAVSQENLPGVEVDETAQVGSYTYALIAFDRSEWAMQLRKQLEDLDRRIGGFEVDYREAERPLARATDLYERIMPVIIEREEVARRLRVADPRGDIPPLPFDLDALMRYIARLVATVTVRLELDESAAGLRPQIVEAMAAEGLSVVPAGADAKLALRLALSTRSAKTTDGTIRYTGAIKGTLTDLSGGRMLGGIDLSRRSSSRDMAVAKEYLEKKLGQAIAAELDQQIIAMVCR